MSRGSVRDAIIGTNRANIERLTRRKESSRHVSGKQLFKTIVLNVFIYGSEAWTLGADHYKTIQAVRCCWRIVKLPRYVSVPDEEDWKRTGVAFCLMKLMVNRRAPWMGNVLRHEGQYWKPLWKEAMLRTAREEKVLVTLWRTEVVVTSLGEW